MHQICTHAERHSGIHGLHAMALTSSILHHHAIEKLWRFQCNLDNILNCFPSGMWKVVHDDKGMEVKVRHPQYSFSKC